jgi:hypothetical protein
MKNLYVVKKTGLFKDGAVWRRVVSLSENGTVPLKTGRQFTLVYSHVDGDSHEIVSRQGAPPLLRRVEHCVQWVGTVFSFSSSGVIPAGA